MEIFYCDGCGRILSREEFFVGNARFIRNRPVCYRCGAEGNGPRAKIARANRHRRRRLLLKRGDRA